MANYYCNGILETTDLLDCKHWHILSKEEYEKEGYDDLSYEEMIEDGRVVLSAPDGYVDLLSIFKNGSYIYPDFNERIELLFKFNEEDKQHLNPIVIGMTYPYEEGTASGENEVQLEQKEKDYFATLLKQSIIKNTRCDYKSIAAKLDQMKENGADTYFMCWYLLQDEINDLQKEIDATDIAKLTDVVTTLAYMKKAEHLKFLKEYREILGLNIWG